MDKLVMDQQCISVIMQADIVESKIKIKIGSNVNRNQRYMWCSILFYRQNYDLGLKKKNYNKKNYTKK